MKNYYLPKDVFVNNVLPFIFLFLYAGPWSLGFNQFYLTSVIFAIYTFANITILRKFDLRTKMFLTIAISTALYGYFLNQIPLLIQSAVTILFYFVVLVSLIYYIYKIMTIQKTL
jgi:hypothetical protein